jgi:hypothetical protein
MPQNRTARQADNYSKLSGMAAAGVYIDMRLIRGRQRSGLGVPLVLAIAVCGACNSGTPTFPSPAPPPSSPASPSPPPAPVVPHQVEIVFDSDMYKTPAPRESDGSYLLDWAAGWYCVWLNSIPSTPADHCREYGFTFSWLPSVVSLPRSGPTWSRGCHTYPNQINPSACFQSPVRNSVSALQSLTIVGTERASNRAETEVLRTELAIRFRDR